MAVGMVMVTFGWSPGDVYSEVGKFVWSSVDVATDLLKQLFSSKWGTALFWGASIVVPVWLFVLFLRWRKSEKPNRPPF